MKKAARRNRMTEAGRLAIELLERCPDAPALSLAKRLAKEHPETFASVERARQTVQYYTGRGPGRRSKPTDKRFFREARPAGARVWRPLPKPRPLLENPWDAVRYGGKRRVLVLHDVHIPFHDPRALNAALGWGMKRLRADTVLLNGDTADFYALSHWERRPSRRDFKAEVDDLKAFLEALRDRFPRATIIWKDGNHEERLFRYLEAKAPELWALPELSVPRLLEFERLRIDYVSEMRPIYLGDLPALHGHEYRFAISNPVNPARGLFLRAKGFAFCGHFHQKSEHQGTTLNGKVLRCWSAGCLCDLHPTYRPLNEWSHGVMGVELDESGAFDVQNRTIVEGKVY